MTQDLLDFSLGPQRIVCMTEETTEWHNFYFML